MLSRISGLLVEEGIKIIILRLERFLLSMAFDIDWPGCNVKTFLSARVSLGMGGVWFVLGKARTKG
jgi:hypothetical protein